METKIKYMYWRDGNAVWSSQWEEWQGNFWIIAGSERLIKNFDNAEKAKEALILLQNSAKGIDPALKKVMRNG